MSIERIDTIPENDSEFVNLIQVLYSDSELKMVPNNLNLPYFHTAFYIRNKGRLILFNNPELNINGKKAMSIGFFECVNEQIIADSLITAAREEALKENASWIVGPMNGSTWETYRFSMNHESPNFFLEPYHHLYYNDLWKISGFDVLATYSSSMDKQMNLFNPGRFNDLHSRMKGNGVNIRKIDMQAFDEEIAKVYQFCIMAFAGNYLYTSISEIDFVKKYKQIKEVIDPDFILLAENPSNKIVAIFFAIPDIYNKLIPTLIVKTIARNPQREFAGITHIMGNQIIATAKQKGYQQMIHAFMHNHNESNIVSSKFSGEVFRNYALYAKQIKK